MTFQTANVLNCLEIMTSICAGTDKMMLHSSRFYSKDVDDLDGLFGEVVYETFTDWNDSLDVVPPMEYIN